MFPQVSKKKYEYFVKIVEDGQPIGKKINMREKV